jgi:hypothetical protein
VSDSNVATELFKIYGISVLWFERDTESESEAKGIENRGFNAEKALQRLCTLRFLGMVSKVVLERLASRS